MDVLEHRSVPSGFYLWLLPLPALGSAFTAFGGDGGDLPGELQMFSSPQMFSGLLQGMSPAQHLPARPTRTQQKEKAWGGAEFVINIKHMNSVPQAISQDKSKLQHG